MLGARIDVVEAPIWNVKAYIPAATARQKNDVSCG